MDANRTGTMLIKRFTQNAAFLSARPGLFLRAAGNYLQLVRGRPVLRTLDIDVTYRCPCRCAQCYAADFAVPSDDELGVEEIAEVVRQGAALGALQVLLSGGEPLVRSDLPAVVAACLPERMLVSMCTSGVGVSSRRLQKLADAGLAVIAFSLDALSAAEHERNRGIPGLYQRVLEAIDTCRRLGIRVIVNTGATRQKLADGSIHELASFAHARGAILNLTVPTPIGRWMEEESVLLSEVEQRQFLELLELPGVRNDIESTYLRRGCPAGTQKLSVDAYGEVRTCPLVPASFGNVRSESLAAIWEKVRAYPTLPATREFCPAGDSAFRREQPALFEPAEPAAAER